MSILGPMPMFRPDEPIPMGDRGVFAGGYALTNVIDYITISNTGNATDFGDLTKNQGYMGGLSNGRYDRGVFGSAFDGSWLGNIEYITISTTGNAASFGNLTVTKAAAGGTSNRRNGRGIFAGGSISTGRINVIDYITINTTGNATDFGDLTVAREHTRCASNSENERAAMAGGRGVSDTHLNVIDYITINTTGNATDFGDLAAASRFTSNCSNGVHGRGVFMGGETSSSLLSTIQYITISTTGNTTNFGNLITAVRMTGSSDNRENERGINAGGTLTTGASYVNTIEYITINVTGNATDFGDLTRSNAILTGTSNA